jgi:hypothetical protein
MVQRQRFDRENFGDIITPYLVAKLTGKRAILFWPGSKMARLFRHSIMTGSIISHSRPGTWVWGSGIISRNDAIAGGRFLAVRGPLTAAHLAAMGFVPPTVYGDPGLLLPLVYDRPVNRAYRYGIVAHYVDHAAISALLPDDEVLLIDLLTDDIETVIDKIRSCERVLSSSLHGLIVAHSYGIPAAWWKFSDKLGGDDVKFHDYYASVGLGEPRAGTWRDLPSALAEADFLLPDAAVVKRLQAGLLDTFPYRIRRRVGTEK